MKRRELIAFASGVLIFPSVSSLAQAPPKAVRLGILEAGTREDWQGAFVVTYIGRAGLIVQGAHFYSP
jgi:hypothetical protein